MELINNECRYISNSTLHRCFQKGKHIKVDKVITGNGFSTAFLMEQPPVSKVNIMIAPNKAVIIDKRDAYNSGRLDSKNHIGFFYKEGTSLISDSYNIMVFVADSFYLYSKQLWKIRRKINWILIDEAHSVEIQSSFRWVLRDFDNKVERFLNDNVAISSVTASPNHFTKIDIKIINKIIPEQNINITNDRIASIGRIRNDLKNNHKVIVCTNSMPVIYKLRNRDREIGANFIIGSSLIRSCVAAFRFIQDPNSNLMIISARGFEGFDILDENCRVYFFEDRAKDHERFFISNLYQAINRTRKGASYIEYSCRYLADIKELNLSDEDITKFIDNDKITIESKQKKEHESYHKFVIFNQNNEGVFSIKKDTVSHNLIKEGILYDSGFDSFESFLSDRNININDLNETQKPIPNIRLPLEIKKENLLSNKDMIIRNDLFGDEYKLVVRTFEKFEDYKKYLEQYLIRKVFDVGNSLVDENGLRGLNNRELIGLSIFSDLKKFEAIVMKVTKTYNKRSIEKYGKAKSKKYRDEFKEKSSKIVAQFILAFINKQITVPPNWVANRNYNLMTSIGMDEINVIGDLFNTVVQEVDIKSAFPRIIYSKVNKDLPLDFYGEDKKNKITINVSLNNFFYDEKLGIDKKYQKQNAIRKFERLGFNEEVINYLLENYFESKDRGALFHHLSFFEKKLISTIKELFIDSELYGIVRRHDSLILIGETSKDLSFLNNFEFLGVGGWFDFEKVEEEINVFDAEFKDEWE